MRKDIRINVNSENNKFKIDNKTLGITSENLQGKIIFKPEPFVDGTCRMYIDGRGSILMEKQEDCYTVDILSSLLTEDSLDICFKIAEPETEDGIPIFCSKIMKFKVLETIDSSSTIPEDYPSWEQVLDSMMAQIEQMEEDAEDRLDEVVGQIQDLTSEYNTNATNKTNSFNNNYTTKLNSFNSHVNDIIDAFDDAMDEAEQELDDYAADKVQEVEAGKDALIQELTEHEEAKEVELDTYTNAKKTELNTYTNTKKGELDDYEDDKESELAAVASGKTSDFNTNASAKTTAFNTNATEKTTEYNSNHTEKLSSYNDNASSKTGTFNDNATAKTSAYNENASDKTDDFDDNATSKLATYNSNHTEKLGAYNDNATSKTTAFNENAEDKTDDFNDNASVKTTAFNNNATVKTNEYNANASEVIQANEELRAVIESELDTNTVEGTTLDVSDSAEYRGRIEVKGNTEQEQLSGNQLVDFSNYTKISTNGEYTFVNNILIFGNNSGTFSHVEFDITELAKSNSNKVLKFTFEDINLNNQYGTSVQLIVKYNDGTNILYKALVTHDKTVFSYTIPSDTNNIESITLCIYSNNSNTPQASSVTITKPMLQFGTEYKDYEPYCGGQESPNPDFPQNIEVVTGDNTIKQVGKNLLNLTRITENTSSQSATLDKGLITVIWNDGFNLDLYDIISDLDNSKMYTVSFKHKGDALYLRNKKGDTTNILGTNVDLNYTTYSLNLTNINEFQLRFVRKSSTGTAYIKDIQIEEGTTATPYEPYREEEYEVNMGGDNLLVYPYQDGDKTSRGIDWNVNDDGTILVNGTNNDSSASYFNVHYADDTLKLKAGTYTFSLGSSSSVRCTISNYTTGDDITQIRANNSETTFTLSEDTIIRIILAVNSGLTVNNVLVKPQLNPGTTAKRFSQYIANPIELSKIGDYSDILFKNETEDENYNAELEEGAWYKKNVIGIISGSNQFTSNGMDDNRVGLLTPVLNIEANLVDLREKCFCNLLQTMQNNYSGLNGTTASGKIRVYVSKEYVTTYEEAKQLLEDIIIYFVQLNPTYTKITDTTLISQLEVLSKAKWFKGINHWWTETENLVPYIKGTYKQSNSLKIKEQDERLDNLESRLALLE